MPVANAPAEAFEFLPTKESRPSPEYIWSISADLPEPPAAGAATNWSGLARLSDMLICRADL